ncbi:hypothetical protein CO613_09940 [Lysobacteraceae bacterium NML07-0707]|nr:hypothetical protein CO613_09940 [Xanthomonadaceae bacterium NML07-0707]
MQGLGKKFRHYNAAFKLSVLQRIAQEGLSAREALALLIFGVEPGFISDWQRQHHAQSLVGLQPKLRGGPKMSISPSSRPVSTLLDAHRSCEVLLEEEVKYLRAEIAYLEIGLYRLVMSKDCRLPQYIAHFCLTIAR